MSATLKDWFALQTRQMRAAIVLFSAAAFMVVLAGIAWACLPYHGEVSVYPVNPGGQSVDQFAHGERSVTIHGGAQQFDGASGMRWCTNDAGFEGDESEPYEAGAIRPSSHSPDLRVVVEDRLSACGDEGEDELPMGEYNVSLNHAVYGEHANPDFDKDAVSEAAGDRASSCYFEAGDHPSDYDYIHPETLTVDEDGGSLTIDDLDMEASSAARPFDNVAGLCLRDASEDPHIVGPIAPVEILSTDSHPRSNGNGNGKGNGR